MNAVIYRRVSTPHQAEGHGLQRQLDEAYSWCEEMEYDIFAVVTDVDSGANSRRPGIAQLGKIIQFAPVGVVVVESHDRLDRGSGWSKAIRALATPRGIHIEYSSRLYREFAEKLEAAIYG